MKAEREDDWMGGWRDGHTRHERLTGVKGGGIGRWWWWGSLYSHHWLEWIAFL